MVVREPTPVDATPLLLSQTLLNMEHSHLFLVEAVWNGHHDTSAISCVIVEATRTPVLHAGGQILGIPDDLWKTKKNNWSVLRQIKSMQKFSRQTS